MLQECLVCKGMKLRPDLLLPNSLCSQCPSPGHRNCAALPGICCSRANISSSPAVDSGISLLIKPAKGLSTSIYLCSKPRQTDLAEADVRLIIAGLLHWKAIYSLGSVSQSGKREQSIYLENHRDFGNTEADRRAREGERRWTSSSAWVRASLLLRPAVPLLFNSSIIK